MQTPDFHHYPFGDVPKRLNDFFNPEKRDIVGRTEELAAVRSNLLADRATVLVNGIGGIGKTTVARKYVELHWDEYRHIAWLTVASPQSLDNDPNRVADKGYSPLRDAFLRSSVLWQNLGVAAEVEKHLNNKDLDSAFEAIRHRLGQLQDCLLIIDNANETEDLLEHRPALKSINAHVLVTSRARPKEWQIVEVNELPLPLAVELFRQHYAHPSLGQTTENELNTLAETLLRHTLLLELVGKSANPEGGNIPFPLLLESLQNQSFHDRYLNELPVDAGDHADGQNLRRQANVEGYISLIFNHISHLREEHCDLLKAMTLLPPAQAYNRDFLSDHCKLLEIEFLPTRAETLVQLGWLKKEALPEGGVGYCLHPLILDVAFRELGVTAEWADKVLEYVAELINYDDQNVQHNFQEKRDMQPLGDHLGKLFFHAETERVAYLLDRLANLEKFYGFYKNAARLAEQALQIAEQKLSEEIISTRQSNLAIIYRNLGEYERARDLLEKALSTDEKNFGPDHPNVTVRQSNLALVHMNLGEYERARDLLEKALSSAEKNFGPDHPDVAVRQSNLANVYRNLGEYERARDLLEKALSSFEKNFGPDHPNVAIRQSNLAVVYSDMGEHERARDLLEKALRSDEKNFGPGHPDVATDYCNLAYVYFAEKNYSAAIAAFQEALRIVEKTLGKDHPYYKMSSESLEAAQRAAAK